LLDDAVSAYLDVVDERAFDEPLLAIIRYVAGEAVTPALAA
jgi:hypothetical protein